MSPQRIQLSRKRGWRKPEGAIVVSRPSKWGNPYRVSPFMGGWSVDFEDTTSRVHIDVYETQNAAREAAVDLFNMAVSPWAPRDSLPDYPMIADMQRDLAGHDLACWCPLSSPCHADVLLDWANS